MWRSGYRRTQAPADRPGGSSVRRRASQPPGSAKTTTSPRWMSKSFCTTTRSWTSSVFSIDCDGMMNIWPTKARSSEETTSAPTTTIRRAPGEAGSRRPPHGSGSTQRRVGLGGDRVLSSSRPVRVEHCGVGGGCLPGRDAVERSRDAQRRRRRRPDDGDGPAHHQIFRHEAFGAPGRAGLHIVEVASGVPARGRGCRPARRCAQRAPPRRT